MIVLQMGPYPPPHGGVQTNLVAIREHQRRHQISAPVINLTGNRGGSPDDVYYPRSWLQVLRLLVTIPADVIHLHIGGELTARLLGLCFVCTLLPGRRVVLTFHSGGYASSQTGQKARARSLRGFVLRRLDAIIAVNAEIVALFRRLGVDPARIHLICPYAPVSVSVGAALPHHVETFRSSHAPLMTTVGLLEPEYDLPLQIRALAIVRRSFPRAGLVIIGSGSLEPELRQLLASHPDGSHVLLCGDVPHTHTLGIIHKSDLFLRTTLYDGDSVSVREALQLGVPVIASDNGMRPPGVHLVPREDERALARAVETLLRAPEPRVAPTGRGTEDLDKILNLYRRLVGGDRAVGQQMLSNPKSP